MGLSAFLFVALTASLCSLGSLTQTLDSVAPSDTVEIPQSAGGNTDRLKNVAGRDTFGSESLVEGSGQTADILTLLELSNEETAVRKESERLRNANHSGTGITLTTRPALSVYSSGAHNQGADKTKGSVTGSERSTVFSEDASFDGDDDLQKGEDHSRIPVQTSVFTFMNDPSLSRPGSPCVLGALHCTIFNSFNGTSLLWDDMSRTLAFAWELHVFGSASLFVLITALAALGIAGACTLPHTLCDALTLSNSFLAVAGALRTTLLLVDPYGTRQILPHATLAALHNIPLLLLLWTQVVLALVTLRGIKVTSLPSKLQSPWVVGVLGVSHCTFLLLADLYSSTLPPAFPLLLQTISLCWGIPFCLGILTKSLSHSQPFSRSAVPEWVPSQRTKRLGKRVTAVCAFLGVLCCSIQIYSVLWLYGLLGNWRRFSWGWWLSQFWARIFELAWGFSVLFLGSWVFWTPSKGQARGVDLQGRDNISKKEVKKSLWQRVLVCMQRGLRGKSEKSLEDLMPNNIAKHNMSRSGVSNNALHGDKQAPSKLDYSSDPVSISCSDSQTALLWQKVGERECVLSLIEFDMRPPSPINLRLSIDNALCHGQLIAGAVFTPPPPSWTQSLGTDGERGPTTFPPAYVRYGWMMDTESISASLDHFQAKEPAQSVNATPDFNSRIGSPAAEPTGEQFTGVMLQNDWSDDDVTDL
ncbi:proline-rich transmembrane protein 3 [Xiphophorus couchianus]|uniref:proline-rich transmembrane protein 3 n=1 Tax=Xiphophorus couchianus TaxID=32473 RepID=UPI001015DDB2|nr:proline-rich transmembrane protein 3-like [Xiphophorus couchianus]